MSETVLPKTQTTSPTTPHYRRFSPRWSALWAPHHPEPRPRHLEPQPYRRQTGGIAALEARHAVARLLMVQNPHRQSSAALLKGQRARASPGATCFPMTPLANGRNCTVRGARSSSPHVEDATKQGELYHERRDTPATRRGKASNGAKPPSPKMRFVDPVSNTRLATSRRYSGVKRRRVPITGTSLSAGTHTSLTKCLQHKPNPSSLVDR